MTLDTFEIIYLITNLFNIVVYRRFNLCFFEKRRSKTWLCALSYISFFVFTSFIYLFVDIPILTLLVSYSCIFVLTLNYRSGMRKRILCSLYITAFSLITEIIVTAVTGYFDYSIFTQGSYNNCVGAIAIRLLTYIEALLLYNYSSVKRSKKVNGSIWLTSVFIPVASFVLYVFVVQYGNVTQTIVFLTAIIIFLINFMTFFLYDSLAKSYMKLSEATILEKEREFYFNQCTLMQNSTNDLRALRHDIKNQMIGISQLLDAAQYEDAKELVEKISGKLNAKKLFSTTGNIPLDSIINYKLQCAENEQVKVETEIVVPDELNIDIADSITILGNVLDNAIYALKQVKKTERYLKLKVTYTKGCLIIQCENPYETELQYKNGKLISSKSDKNEHGFGLKNIEATAQKYNGNMNISHENSVFVIKVALFLPIHCKK